MKNKYFDEIRNKRLDREKSNLNNKGVKNKKRNTNFCNRNDCFCEERIQHQLFPHRSKTLPPLFLTFGFSDIDVKKSFVFPQNFRA